MFSNQAYIFTIIYWAVSDCSCKDWIASECFLDIKHLNTAKVYCTITEATRKPAYFKHQPIRDHFIKKIFVCRCALEHVWAYIASINVSLNRIHITLTSFCVSLLLHSASGVEYTSYNMSNWYERRPRYKETKRVWLRGQTNVRREKGEICLKSWGKQCVSV